MNSFSPDVEQLIQASMASGRYASENELLLCALQALEASDEELQAIEAGLESIDNGEPGVPLDEAFQSLRSKYNLSS